MTARRTRAMETDSVLTVLIPSVVAAIPAIPEHTAKLVSYMIFRTLYTHRLGDKVSHFLYVRAIQSTYIKMQLIPFDIDHKMCCIIDINQVKLPCVFITKLPSSYSSN